ncbi:MAG: hypothetical protein ACO306_06735 [Flavobacteriaceae bacterium]
MKHFLFLLGVMISFSVYAQSPKSIKGQVLYRSQYVPNEHVINTTSNASTITDEQGQFELPVSIGDELVFMAFQYNLALIIIDQQTLDRGRLVVEVTEKVTALEEVVVGPENETAFIKLKNEEFKSYYYEIDRGSSVDNIAQPMSVRGLQNGLNFVSLFKLLRGAPKTEDQPQGPQLKLSELLVRVYDDSFFTQDLALPGTLIPEFLVYCDQHVPTQSLLLKKNEFELIDFLVAQSSQFKAMMDVQ